MTLTRRDAVAASLTGLAMLAFLATHEGWNVPLIGDSHRWAAAVVMALGIGACSAGAKRVTSALFGVLGGAAFVLGVLAIRWADGRFPFSTLNPFRRRHLYWLNQRRIVGIRP